MMSSYSALSIIFVQEMAGSAAGQLPAGIVFALGSLLFALGTIGRRSLSERKDARKAHQYQPRTNTASGEANRRTVESVRGTGKPRTRISAA
jgi:hypothetical protein